MTVKSVNLDVNFQIIMYGNKKCIWIRLSFKTSNASFRLQPFSPEEYERELKRPDFIQPWRVTYEFNRITA